MLSASVYYNFASSEPNNAASIGFYDNAGTLDSGEYCLHMYSQARLPNRSCRAILLRDSAM